MNKPVTLEEKIQLRALQSTMKSDLTLEQVRSEYFDTNVILEQPETIYRLDYSGQRFYCRVVKDEKGNIVDYFVYPSVTTIIKKNIPMNPYLLQWYCDYGYNGAQKEAAIAASYGTLLHILFAELLRGNTVHLAENNLIEIIKIHAQYERWYSEIDIRKWVRNIRQDLVGFIIWMKDYEIEPIGIEYIEFSDVLQYATAIDLIAKARLEWIKEGKQIIIVDFKSGRKQFYDENPIQLQACLDLWNHMHPEFKAIDTFNYGCKDYRIPLGKTVQPYRFEIQTENISAMRWLEYLKIYHREFMPTKEEIAKRITIDEIPLSKDVDISTIFKEIEILQNKEVEF